MTFFTNILVCMTWDCFCIYHLMSTIVLTQVRASRSSANWFMRDGKVDLDIIICTVTFYSGVQIASAAQVVLTERLMGKPR